MRDPDRAQYPCPCCGWIVFDEEPGSYDICPLCGWEDDLSQLRFPEMGGANIPLVEAQALAAGRTTDNTDPARLGYRREQGWRPIDLSSDTLERPEHGQDYGMTCTEDRTEYYYWRQTRHALGRGHYPPADATPAEFEQFVVNVFRAAEQNLEQLDVELHDRVSGVDGSYDMDGTVRFRWNGVDFLVLLEAKLHTHPIKRELVQVLNQKVQSTGAHKGVMVATSPFQSGALEFGKTHGIALVEVTEGRFTYHTRSATEMPPLSRTEAAEQFGLPVFVGHCYGPGGSPGATAVTLISPEYPEYIETLLLGIPDGGAA